MLDYFLCFLAGYLVGAILKKHRVVYVSEETFDVGDPAVPEDVKTFYRATRTDRKDHS